MKGKISCDRRYYEFNTKTPKIEGKIPSPTSKCLMRSLSIQLSSASLWFIERNVLKHKLQSPQLAQNLVARENHFSKSEFSELHLPETENQPVNICTRLALIKEIVSIASQAGYLSECVQTLESLEVISLLMVELMS